MHKTFGLKTRIGDNRYFRLNNPLDQRDVRRLTCKACCTRYTARGVSRHRRCPTCRRGAADGTMVN